MSASLLDVSIKIETRRRPSKSAALAGVAASPASAAFAAYQTLTQDCATATTAVNNATFGPFGNSGSCSYHCGTSTQGWNWNVDYTTGVKTNNLLPALSNLNAGNGFATAFLPAQTWAGSSLPGYTAQITSALATIKSIDTAIGPTGQATPEQAAQLQAAFMSASTQASGSNGQANAALQSLTQFLTAQAPLQGSLGALSSSQQTAVDTSITNSMNDLIGRIACGGDTVTSQFNAMKGVVDLSFATINPLLNTADGQFATASNTASAISGVFANLQSQAALVTQHLQLAQSLPPGSAIRTLKLTLATENWNELASNASLQLGS